MNDLNIFVKIIKMRATILDTFQENNKDCYLSSIFLDEYIKSLPENYNDYEVQREIVKNTYLDDLITTLLLKKHIPPIVLVVEHGNYSKKENILHISDFKILDGLQRTFRLRTIYLTIDLLIKELKKDDEILTLSKFQISKKYKESLDHFNSSSALLIKIIKHYKENLGTNTKLLSELFKRNQWFEVWVNLSPEEEVNKMLILNAGHKPVKTKHQLELLFRNIFDNLNKIEDLKFTIIREKEKSSTTYSKVRDTGEYHFSHLITSILSFAEASPLTSNVNLVQKSQGDYFNDEVFDKFLNLAFLKEFLKNLIVLDQNLSNLYGQNGRRWLGRETSLVGIFAAIGKYAIIYNETPISALKHFNDKVIEDVTCLRIDDFEDQRNRLELAKINIGNVNKKAVYNGVFDILSNNTRFIDWAMYFKNNG